MAISIEEWRESRLRCKETNRERLEHNLTEVYREMGWRPFENIVYWNSAWPTVLNGTDTYSNRWSGRGSRVSNKHLERMRLLGQELSNNEVTPEEDPFTSDSFNRIGYRDFFMEFERVQPYRFKRKSPLGSAWQAILEECIFVCLNEKTVHVVEFPREIHFNADGRLHNLDGPAISWRNGEKAYWFNGVRVTKKFVEGPIKMVAEDEYGKLWIAKGRGGTVRREVRERLWDDFRGDYITTGRRVDVREDLVFLELQNSTAEPDGSYKTYFLRVPPRFRTPKAAIAWTFGVKDYQPKAMS
jgi:hypothetical protein